MSTPLKTGLRAALLLLLLAGAGLTQRAMDQQRSIRFVDRTPQWLPNGEVLRWMSLGHRSTLADLLWIQAVLYYGRRVMDEDNPYYAYMVDQGHGDEELGVLPKTTFSVDTVPGMDKSLLSVLYRMEGRGLVDDIYPLLDRVTTLDPHFVTPYLFGGVMVLMDTGEIDPAEALLTKGLEANPGEWRFPFYLGWLAWMYRGDARRANDLMAGALALKGCPAFVADLVAGLSGRLNRLELTRRYLMGLWGSTESPELKQQIEKMLEKLGASPSKGA